jgi:hypothetical protein
MGIAGRSFKTARPKNKVTFDPLKLWGMNVPHCEDPQYTYQFWVIHLKGLNGPSFIMDNSVNDRSKFHKFESSLVNSFNLQFDVRREEEKQNIREGLLKDCETLYVVAFNLIKPNTITIVAAVQFCTTPDGAWINWLGVSADVCNSGDMPMTNSVGVFRRLGFGTFLQSLIQFQQLAKGWLPRLFLQTLLNGDACQYYINRGYIKAPHNVIKSVPDIMINPFHEKHQYFVPDEMQAAEGEDRKSYLALFYRDGFVVTTYLDDAHSFFFLEGAQMKCLPKDKSEFLFRFPYNTSGSELEDNLGDGALRLFYHQRKGERLEEYVLPENTPKSGLFKAAVREINQFERHFDSADINVDEYLDMKKDPEQYLKDQTMAFWGRWLLRNPNSVASQDAAIIPPYITKEVNNLFDKLINPGTYGYDLNKNLISTLDKVDKYLYGHPDLLQKRLVFFVVNQEFHHWYGFCAVNPWKAIVMALRKRNATGLHSEFKNKRVLDYRAGIFHSDSQNTSFKPPYFRWIRPFLWMLNMMSHYRDLNVSGNRDKINFVKMHHDEHSTGLHMYLMGMDGPYGNLFSTNLEDMPFPLLERPSRVVFKQPNNYDCGLCWGLFVYDTLLAFEHRPFLDKETCVDDAANFLGHFVHSQGFLKGGSYSNETKNVLVPLCRLWRHECLLIIERIRYLYLAAKHCDITRPNEWGGMTEEHKSLVNSKTYDTHLKPILDMRDHQPRAPFHKLYLKEKYFRIRMGDKEKGPTLTTNPGMFLDFQKFAQFIRPRLLPDSTLGKKVWDDAALIDVKARLIHARFWCDLILSSKRSWYNLIHPEEGSNPTFPDEVKRLTSMGIPGDLIDMVGDGNCLYYCMLHFLYVRADTPMGLNYSMLAKKLSLTHDYPLVGMRKLIREEGCKLSESYWTTLASFTREERLDFIYNPITYFMDDTFTRNTDNVDYQGDQFDAIIFAAAFKIRVVVFCRTKSAFTMLMDGRTYNETTQTGLLFCSIPGIHPESVPSGPDVLQVVLYITDDPDLGVEMGPEHWVLVQNKDEHYEPESTPEMTDHGLVDPPPPPIKDKPPPTDPLPPPPPILDEASKKANKDKKKRELAQASQTAIAKRLRDREDSTNTTPQKKRAAFKRATGQPKGYVPRATKAFGEDGIKGDAQNWMKEKPPSETPLTFLADEVASACKWPVNSVTYADNQLNFKLAHEIMKHNLDVNSRPVLGPVLDRTGVTRKGVMVDETAFLEAEMMIVKNVHQIAWVPAAKGRKGPAASATTLRGHFRVKVKMDGQRKGSGSTTTNASIEWVEKHFKHTALGIAQRVSYEVREELNFADKNIPQSRRYGYLKVEAEGITCSAVDQRVINRLKYIPLMTISTGPAYKLDKKGKRVRLVRPTKTREARWVGYCNETREMVDLEEPWVRQNFDENYLAQVMSSTKSTTAFIHVPPGDRRKHQNVGPMMGPTMKYEQMDGEQTCMLYSMASAMHYFDQKSVGSWIYNGRKRFLHQTNGFTFFINKLKSAHTVLNQVRVMKDQLPSFLGTDLKGLYLARVQGSDGKEEHCVAISNKWIFDSNFPCALPRSQESLDLCCSTDTVTSKFTCFPQIAHFTKVKATN